MVESPIVLEVRGLTKRFPGVLANDHIHLKLHKGQVLGLLGENGAGKSTLMNLIYGLYAPDEGEILVNGQAVTIHDANDAIRFGDWHGASTFPIGAGAFGHGKYYVGQRVLARSLLPFSGQENRSPAHCRRSPSNMG
jgi:energy-coupling factor transporter ATP-binding protein EcfA2